MKEVGEGATIGSLATSGDGWRGRAQQILTLQNKVWNYFAVYIISLW